MPVPVTKHSPSTQVTVSIKVPNRTFLYSGMEDKCLPCCRSMHSRGVKNLNYIGNWLSGKFWSSIGPSVLSVTDVLHVF